MTLVRSKNFKKFKKSIVSSTVCLAGGKNVRLDTMDKINFVVTRDYVQL